LPILTAPPARHDVGVCVVVAGVGGAVVGVAVAVVGAVVGVAGTVVFDAVGEAVFVAVGEAVVDVVGEAVFVAVGEAVVDVVGEAVVDVVGEAGGVVVAPLLATVKFPPRREVVPFDHVSTTLMLWDPSDSFVVSYGTAVPSSAVPAKSKGGSVSVRTGGFVRDELSR
jgi:hypothetical protein